LVVTEGEQTASFIRNFNPLLELGDVRWPTVRGMYEPLMIFDQLNGKWVPWLATDYRWERGAKELVFEIREGVKWSDGRDMTIRDIEFTFELIKKFPALDLRGAWKHLESIRTEGQSIHFVFKAPHVPGMGAIAHQPIVPEHVWASVEDPVSWNNPDPVATGPFTEILKFETQVYEIGRNPHYWMPNKPAFDAMRFPAFAANDQATLALVSGEVDWAGYFVPAIDRTYVGKDPEHHDYWFPLIEGCVFLYPNTTKPPYDQVQVRKAISRAIDRELLVEVAMHGYTRPADASGLSDAYAKWRDPQVVDEGTWVQHDTAAAEAAFDAAGLTKNAEGWRVGPDGEVWQPQVHVPSGFSDWVRGGQVIVAGLREAGVDASLKTYDFGAWYDKIQRGEFELSIGWSVPEPSPYDYFRNLMSSETVAPIGESSNGNWHRFANPEADAALAALRPATDEKTQREAVNRLQRVFSEFAPAIPLFPGPVWAEFNDRRFTGFPTQDNPYAPPTPGLKPQALLVLTELQARPASEIPPR
jgi:peptide/nickel transport system substrate-binding protein